MYSVYFYNSLGFGAPLVTAPEVVASLTYRLEPALHIYI